MKQQTNSKINRKAAEEYYLLMAHKNALINRLKNNVDFLKESIIVWYINIRNRIYKLYPDFAEYSPIATLLKCSSTSSLNRKSFKIFFE